MPDSCTVPYTIIRLKRHRIHWLGIPQRNLSHKPYMIPLASIRPLSLKEGRVTFDATRIVFLNAEARNGYFFPISHPILLLRQIS